MSGAVAPKLLERNPVSSKLSIFRACRASLHQEYHHQILPHPLQLALSKQEEAPLHSRARLFNHPCFFLRFLRAALSLPAQAQTDAQVPTRNYICVKVHACEKKDLLHFHGSSQDLILDVYQTCMLVVSIDVDARTQCKMLAKRSAHGVCSHASCAHGRWLSLGREFIYELCIHNNATTMPQYRVMTCWRRCSRVTLAGGDFFCSTQAMGSCKNL